MKNVLPAALGVLSLLGVTATTMAAEEETPATVEKMAEKLINAPEEADETITTTAQVQAVDLEKRKVTLEDKEGNVFTIDVPPEVRRLAEIKPGDLVVARYSEALAIGLNKTDRSSGIRAKRESASVERAGMDQPPGGVARETVEILANIIAIDKAKRWVTIKGAEHMVVLKAAEDIDLDAIKVGDEVLAEYVQELAITVEPAPAAAVDAWNAK